MVVIFIAGVAVFSIIMDNFLTTVKDIRYITSENDESEKLSQFLSLLKKLNKGNIKVEFKDKIEDYFLYLWSNDKLACFKTESDMRYFDEMDHDQKVEIFKEYLFKDFIITYRRFFTIPKNLKFSHSYFKWTDPYY